MINEQIHHACEAKTHTDTHTHCISIGKIPKCQPSTPASTSPSQLWYCFTGWESFGPFGFVVIKSSPFILFCCLLGNIWKKLKGWMTKGCAFTPLYSRIVWRNSPSAGEQAGGGVPWRGNAIGQGRTEDLKWGTVQILLGPHVTKGPRGFFVMLGAKPREFSLDSFAANQKK